MNQLLSIVINEKRVQMPVVYQLLSKIINENQIQISVIYNDIIISTKFITLELNGDNAPTFGDTRMVYTEVNIDELILCMRHKQTYFFTFDYDEAENIFDGFMYNNGDNGDECFIIKTCHGSKTMSCNIPLHECKDNIISGILVLKENIEKLYDERIKYVNHIVDNDDSDTNNDNCDF